MITSVTFVVVSGRVPTTAQFTFKKVNCSVRLWLKSKLMFLFFFFFAAGDVVVALILCLCCVGVRWSLALREPLSRMSRVRFARACIHFCVDTFSVEKQPFYAWLARQHVAFDK